MPKTVPFQIYTTVQIKIKVKLLSLIKITIYSHFKKQTHHQLQIDILWIRFIMIYYVCYNICKYTMNFSTLTASSYYFGLSEVKMFSKKKINKRKWVSVAEFFFSWDQRNDPTHALVHSLPLRYRQTTKFPAVFPRTYLSF